VEGEAKTPSTKPPSQHSPIGKIAQGGGGGVAWVFVKGRVFSRDYSKAKGNHLKESRREGAVWLFSN